MLGCQPKDPSLMITQEINEGWQFAEDGKVDWLPASVPGCVHTDLLANEKIEDPFYRLNEHDLQWIDKLNWAYKTNIRVEKDLLKRSCVMLDFKGLDTYADIFMNGEQVTSTDNMFREYLVNVKPFLQEGDNELKVVFRSPIIEGLEKYDAHPFVIPVSGNDLAEIGQVEGNKKVSVYTRKAGYHFGWDWGPRLVTSGIWRPVYLKAWDDARISNLQIVQHEVNEQKATFTAVVEVESEKSGPAIIQLENDGQVLATAQVKLQAGSATYPVDCQIADPKL